MEEEGWSGDEEDSLPPLLHFRPVKITRPVHNSVVPCHFSILLCRWRTPRIVLRETRLFVAERREGKKKKKNCKKLQASPVDLGEHARADGNATYRLFTVSPFVMDSNFAEDGETRRSTDRTISRQVVDLTLDNCFSRYWRYTLSTRKTTNVIWSNSWEIFLNICHFVSYY